uniref:Nuclease HARBI1 n=1 Tax=Diabrotica virgifera virgifera TaxID=50390 RepID=A0A6P7H3R6_DIAVI
MKYTRCTMSPRYSQLKLPYEFDIQTSLKKLTIVCMVECCVVKYRYRFILKMDINFVDLIEHIDIVDEEQYVPLFALIPRKVFVRKNPFDKYGDAEFFVRFRLTKECVLHILEIVEPELEYMHNLNNSLSPINQLLVTLRMYATGSHLVTIGDFIEADKSTMSRIVKKVTGCLASLRPNYIKMPQTEPTINQRQQEFYEIARFPRVIGAIDGCHVKINHPGGEDGEIYRNRKSYFSINVQAVVSANFLFQDIVARWPGSAHDSTIFNNSRVKQRFEEGEFGNGILLGPYTFNLIYFDTF